ncbi:MAG: VacJ family lipoprotein [Thermomonas sp.]
MIRPTYLQNAVLLSLALLVSACTNGGGVRTVADTSTLVSADHADVQVDAAQPGSDAISVMPAPVNNDADPIAAGDTTTMVPPQDPGEATQAERDYNAIYGAPSDPVADPTMATPYLGLQSYDPWEKYNRHMYAFNAVFDRSVLKPLAKTYAKVVPEPARNGVSNFFNNLGQPATIVNALLQGKGKLAAQSLGRFALNTTVGIVGIFDPATRIKILNRSEDFGQTLGVWGWKRSRFLVLPLFGPSTVRDALGIAVNGRLSPLRYVEEDKPRVFLQVLGLVDLRTRLFPLDNLVVGATDEYVLVRDSWLQRRDYQISRSHDANINQDEQQLPDFLQEDESDPNSPSRVTPIIPGT